MIVRLAIHRWGGDADPEGIAVGFDKGILACLGLYPQTQQQVLVLPLPPSVHGVQRPCGMPVISRKGGISNISSR